MARSAAFFRGPHFVQALLLGVMALAAPLWAAPPQFVYENDFAGKWGSGGAGDGQFTQPAGIAQDSEGNIFVADISNSRVQKFDSEGQYLSQFGGFGAGDGQFFSPHGVAINSSDEIYVVDFSASGNRVQQFDADGVFIRAWGTGGSANGEFQNPQSLCVAPNGNVYVSDYGNDRIQIFEPDGDFVRAFGTEGTANGELDFPDGIAVDGNGNVYVVDRANNRVQVFDSSDAFVRTWGTVGSGDGQFDSPGGLALGADGIIYVTDFNNDRVQAFTTEGVFLGKWGTAGNADGQFQGPRGVMVTASGRVYVSNSDGGVGNRVQYFEPIWNVTMDEDGDVTDFALTLSAIDADADTITWSISSGASNGTAEVSGTGASQAITYTPDMDYNGADNFDVQIDDGNAGTATRTVYVTINPINDWPDIDQAGPLQVTMSKDGNPDPFVPPVVTATDPDGDTIQWGVSFAASHGTAVVSGSGVIPPVFTYTPTAGYTGSDVFTIEASDGFLSDTVVVYVLIEEPDAPPVIDQGAGPLEVEMAEDGSFAAPTLSATDADTDAAILSWSVSVPASSGFADLSGFGPSPFPFTYTPATDFEGSDSFTVMVSDGVLTDTIVVNVTVTPEPDSPVIFQGAGPLSVTMSEDGDPTGFVRPTLYATDVDGDTLTWSVATSAANGTAEVSGSGSSATVLDYTPDADFAGLDSFTVQVSDGVLSDTMVIQVTVEATDDAPEIDQGAGPLEVTMDEDGTFTAPALSATDPDEGATLTWSLNASPASGTATISGTGTSPAIFTYAPNADFNGSDAFMVQVSDGAMLAVIAVHVTVTPVNDLPVIDQGAGPLTVTMSEDGVPTTFAAPTVSATDVDGDTLTWSVTTQPANGAASASGTGASPAEMTFTPEADFTGTDGFVLRVSDGEATDDIAIVVTVEAVNDAPRIEQGDGPVIAGYNHGGDTPGFYSGPLSASDIDTDAAELTWTLLTPPTEGTAEVSGSGAAPTTYTYTVDEEFLGADSFVVQVSDGEFTDTITVDVTVNDANDRPVITQGDEPIVVAMDEDGSPTAFAAPSLDATDADGDPLSWSLSSQASIGSAVVSGEGASPGVLTYTPNENYNGTDSFVVAVSDGRGGIDTITLEITVNSVNDPVVIAQEGPLTVTMDEDGTFTAPALSATDLDGDTLTWSVTSPATSGVATVSGDGSSPGVFGYVPQPDFNGEDSFEITVSDNAGATDSIAVSVTVNAINDAPTIAEGDAAVVTMSEDGSPTAFVAPTVTATDAEGDPLSWSLGVAAEHGTTAATGDGASPSITYAPDADYFGVDGFTVEVSDGNGGTDTIVIAVTVSPVGDGIEITQGDSVDVAMSRNGTPTAFVAPTLVADGLENEISTWVWSVSSAASHGTATVGGTGASPSTFTYVPESDYIGTDQFTVQVSDGVGGQDKIEVRVSITRENTAPVFAEFSQYRYVGEWEIPLPEGSTAHERMSLAIGPDNNVYVGENTNIRIYDADGNFIRTFAEYSADSLAVDESGAVYGLFRSPVIMVKFLSDGSIDFTWLKASDLFPAGTIHNATSISAAPNGAVQFVQQSRGSAGADPTMRLRGLSATGTLAYSVDLPGARDNTSAPGNLITGSPVNFDYVAATDAAGNTYVRQQEVKVTYFSPYYYKTRNELINVYSPEGVRLRTIIAPGIPLDAERHIAVSPDAEGIFTSEHNRGRIEVLDGDGTVNYPFGGFGTGEGRFKKISGLAVNEDGRVYVSDAAAGRVQYFEQVAVTDVVDVLMFEDGAFTFPLSVSDADGDTITWVIVEAPENGTATGGTTVGYVPPANYYGNASFVVAAEDGFGGSTAIEVRVAVQPSNDIPVIEQGNDPLVVTMSQNGTPTAFVVPELSATDVEDDPLTWSVENRYDRLVGRLVFPVYTVGTIGGSGTGNTFSAYTYSPKANFVGSDTFVVRVTDTSGHSDAIQIRVAVVSTAGALATPNLADELAVNFQGVDRDRSETLTIAEVLEFYPDATVAQFEEIDTNDDGYLTLTEIQAAEVPEEEEEDPVGCTDPGVEKAFGETTLGKLVRAIQEHVASYLTD